MLAGVELREMGAAATQREAKRNINRAIDSVESAWEIRERFAANTTFTRR